MQRVERHCYLPNIKHGEGRRRPLPVSLPASPWSLPPLAPQDSPSCPPAEPALSRRQLAVHTAAGAAGAVGAAGSGPGTPQPSLVPRPVVGSSHGPATQ